MRHSINFLLYMASLAMLGLAIWLFVQATFEARPLSGLRDGPSFLGFETAARLAGDSEGLDQRDPGDWNMANTPWWEQFSEVNLIGKLPPEPVQVVPDVEDLTPGELEKPLSDIFLLISLMYHNATDEPKTHVVLRYRPDAGVQVPDSVVRQAGSAITGGSPMASPTAPPRPQGVGVRGLTPPPVSMAQNLLLHYVTVGESLWEPYSYVKLVRVSEDAESAFFLRTGVKTPEGEDVEPEEEFKNELDLDPELVAQLVRDQRQPEGLTAEPSRPVSTSSWVDVEVTRQTSHNRYSLSRSDDQLIREDPQKLLDQLTIRPYRSTAGDRSRDGIQLQSVDPQLGARFGVRTGDVIIAVNGVAVTTRSKAIEVGTRLYKQGERRFVVRIMSMGRIDDRVYIAPER